MKHVSRRGLSCIRTGDPQWWIGPPLSSSLKDVLGWDSLLRPGCRTEVVNDTRTLNTLKE